MFEKLLVVVAGVLAPVLASALGTSRRNRQIRKIRGYTELADSLKEEQPEHARSVRELAGELSERLVARERAAMERRFDPAESFGTLTACGLFLAPAVIFSYFAWTRPGFWTWPVVILSGLWTVLIGIVAFQQLAKVEQEEVEEQEAAS